jgi:hypothetical protein
MLASVEPRGDYIPRAVPKLFIATLSVVHLSCYILPGLLLNAWDSSFPIWSVMLCSYVTEVSFCLLSLNGQ